MSVGSDRAVADFTAAVAACRVGGRDVREAAQLLSDVLDRADRAITALIRDKEDLVHQLDSFDESFGRLGEGMRGIVERARIEGAQELLHGKMLPAEAGPQALSPPPPLEGKDERAPDRYLDRLSDSVDRPPGA